MTGPDSPTAAIAQLTSDELALIVRALRLSLRPGPEIARAWRLADRLEEPR